MILIDFSSIIHRMVYTSCSNAKPKKKDGKFITSEFIGLTKRFILHELFNIQQQHRNKFGNLVICLDESSNGYWRKYVYPNYKSNRKSGREKSEINFSEVFKEIDILIQQILLNLPWKVVQVQTAEADDIMLVLAKEYSKYEKILIHSPDKDMIQAQRGTDNVYQYSSLTKKWIKAETKSASMEEWTNEHVCLGDASDGVPKIVDHCEFSDAFLNYLKDVLPEEFEVPKTPMAFKIAELPRKHAIIQNFNVFKCNRKGESTGVLDVYKDTRFGKTNLKKEIKKYGSLDLWLDSHPLYRPHYERNFTLVMEEGIPSDIWNKSIVNYKAAETNYNEHEFAQYLIENDLKSIQMGIGGIFGNTQPLTAENSGW